MIRIIMSIRPSELIIALLVAVGVVVFGVAKEAEATHPAITKACDKLDWYEESGWIRLKRTNCHVDCVWFGQIWTNIYVKIYKSPAIGGCGISSRKCGPGKETLWFEYCP